MSAGALLLPAPARRAGSFAQADKALVRMDLYQQKRGKGVGPATAATDGKLRLERHLDWYGFNAGDFQANELSHIYSVGASAKEPQRREERREERVEKGPQLDHL